MYLLSPSSRLFDLAGGQWPQALPVVVTALAAWAVLVRVVRCTGYLPAQQVMGPSQHVFTPEWQFMLCSSDHS